MFLKTWQAQAKFDVRRLWIQFINGCHGHTLLPVHHHGCVCLEIKGARGDKGGAGCSGFRLIQVPKIEAEWLWLEQWVLWVIPWFHLTSRAEIPEVWKLRSFFPSTGRCDISWISHREGLVGPCWSLQCKAASLYRWLTKVKLSTSSLCLRVQVLMATNMQEWM